MRGKRGVSTIIGMTLLIVILTVFIGSLYVINTSYQTYLQDVKTKTEYLIEKENENLEFTSIILKNNVTLMPYIKNIGGVPVKIVSIWVNDTYIDLEKNNTILLPGEVVGIDTGVVPTSNESLVIKVVTERGNIFTTTWPFLTHIGAGSSSIVGGTGNLSLTIKIAGHAKKKGIEKIGNITLVNDGPVAFKVNWLTVLIAINIDTGIIYSVHLDKVNNTNIAFSQTEFDSQWISPGAEFVLEFKFPPDQKPPAGTYDLYLHLHGYDEWGNIYIQALYLGRYNITE